jgi:hypothetical protein
MISRTPNPPTSEESRKSRLFRTPELWIFTIAFALRIVVLGRFSESSFFLPESDDMKFYSDWALRVARGEFTDGQAFYGLPGYAFAVAAIYTLAGYNPHAVGVLQVGMDALVTVFIFKLAATCFSSLQEARKTETPERSRFVVAGLASLGWVVFQPASCFSIILMPTIWLVLAYWGGVWLVVKTRHSTVWRPWLGLGLLTGLVATMVATILFLIPLLMVGAAITVDRSKPIARRAAKVVFAWLAIFGGIAVGTAPAWMHNYFVAGEPVFLSAHSGINFWIGNSPVATGYPMMPANLRSSQEGLLKDSVTVAQRESGRPLKRFEVSRYWSDKARQHIASDHVAWGRLIAVKLKNFWNAFQYDDLSIIKLLRDDGVLPPSLRFGVVAAFGIPGLLLAGWRFPKLWWVTAAVLLHMCALLPVFVTERYRLAAVPGLLIVGACGLWLLWNDLTRSRWGFAGVYISILSAAAWFVSLPQREVGLWSLDFYKAGIRATDINQLQTARTNLEVAYAYAPDSADINFALGNVGLAEGNHAEAKRYYRRALQLKPSHERVLNNVGVIALREKRYDFAEQCFARALTIEPEDAKMLYLLALTRFEAGNLEAAREPLTRALQLRPKQQEFLDLAKKLAEKF